MTVMGSIWLASSLQNCVAIKEIVITEIVSFFYSFTAGHATYGVGRKQFWAGRIEQG